MRQYGIVTGYHEQVESESMQRRAGGHRWRSWQLALALLWASSARAEPGDDVLWFARTQDTTTVQVQIHPSGHSWMRFYSHSQRGKVRVFAVLDVAVLLNPETYSGLRRALAAGRMERGDRVNCGFDSLGITPIPKAATHELPCGLFNRLVNTLRDGMESTGARIGWAWKKVMAELPRAGLSCGVSARRYINATLRKSNHTRLAIEGVVTSTGADCLLTERLKHVLEREWSPAVEKISFEATLLMGSM